MNTAWKWIERALWGRAKSTQTICSQGWEEKGTQWGLVKSSKETQHNNHLGNTLHQREQCGWWRDISQLGRSGIQNFISLCIYWLLLWVLSCASVLSRQWGLPASWRELAIDFYQILSAHNQFLCRSGSLTPSASTWTEAPRTPAVACLQQV